jgi:hypothetical protein
VLAVLLTLSIVLLIFQYQPAQTWAAKRAASYLSKKLHTTVSIKSLYLKPFTAVVLKDFFILDQQRDTLISTPSLTVDVNGFSPLTSINEKKLDLSLIRLDNGSFFLKKLKNGKSNLSFILDFFKSSDTTKKTGKPFKVIFEKIAISNFHFRYKNMRVDTLIKGVNFDDVDVHSFSAQVSNMDITNHLFKGNVKNLTLREKSGFYIRNLTANATVDSNRILAQHLLLITAKSTLRDFFLMKFKSFDDIGDHIRDKVYMDGDFKDSRISSYDISFFTDGLERVKFDLGLDGRIKGYVNNLRAKDLLITGGQSTYLRGDFHLTGLPTWHNTFLDLNFDEISTNKADMDYLYKNFTGDNHAEIPVIIGKFGNIHFTGRFTGLQNDFVAVGVFKTKLGRFDPDINFKMSGKGIPAYSGKISMSNFDLGALLSQTTLGRTTLAANFNGNGNTLKNLAAKVDARVSYIGVNGYNYNNAVLSGAFYKKNASAHLTINDKNINLDLNGKVDLNPKLPVYDVTASIKNAELNTLKLLNDTITFSTGLTARFSGNDLDNLQGSLLLSPSRIVDPRHNYIVDSVFVAANGLGTGRVINLKSDFADGTLRGSYDLNTFPSYFKTIAKKYIPSLNVSFVPPKPQNFEFNLAIKKPDPLLSFFSPDLSIPDQGTLNGKFNSLTKTATLDGYIKTIRLDKTVFHDLIIDEDTNNDNLGLNISLSRINFSDSLFIKNISITNFLKRDSLNFNVKLADKNATNQLDLYGLVEFGKDTTAKLKILPSDVILEHQNWRIQEQVRVRLFDGKTQISGFEFTNGTQKVKINGFISSDPLEKLKIQFDKFSMATLDQLTRPAGIKLKGILNGNVDLSGILKTPDLDAQLKIDSLKMNQTLVGNVDIRSNLDNEKSQANIKLDIFKKGLQTMNINGSYQFIKNADDKLDFDIKMDQAEAIIFDPFVKNLVSNLKGTISTNLKLTGTAAEPKLNGDITLDNTGVTVNYLKTAYVVNDKLTVSDNLIKVDNMVLTGLHGGTGTANGTVNLSNLSNPDIEVELNAKNLMALNTTFKDNHIYYGQAYSTGTFKFNGPVDNMKIDIKAKTEAGTVFNLPINSSSTTPEYDFVIAIGHNDIKKPVNTVKAFNGVTLNFDLSVDEKTVVKITTDYGKLEGSGVTNNLNLNINSLGDFEMFGDFLITTGKFDFTAKNYISKNFTVNQGGTIRWTGNPANAEINLKAIYEVRADISKLYTAAGLSYHAGSQLKTVQTELVLTKSLLLPKIDFDFNFPTDPAVKDDVGTYLSDENNRSQQALSVIITQSFNPGTGNGTLTDQVATTSEQVISEFAFNKLNALIAQSNIKYLDLNIQSLNDASATLRFYNGRVIFTGSVFTVSGNNNLFANSSNLLNSNINNILTDFSGQYLIFPDGALRARYSYRLINTTTLNSIDQLSNQYVNGLGLVYQRDFDTFGEFLRNIFRSNKKQAVNPLPVPNSATPSVTARPSANQ